MLEHQILDLVAKYIPSAHNRSMKIEQLSGLTNITYGVYVDDVALYIFKVYSDGFDRESENKIVKQLSELKLAPLVIHAEKTFRIEEFLENTRHPNQQDFSNFTFLKRIIKHIHRFHQAPVTNYLQSFSDYLFSQPLKEQLSSLRKCKSHKGNIIAYDSLFHHLDLIIKDRATLSQQLLPKNKQTERFCHNDLYNMNILYNQVQIHFIDYDFARVNYLAYDIANFINETTIDYMVNDYPGFKLIKKLTLDEINQYAKLYPGQYVNIELDVLKFMCVVNLFWAFWCLKRFHVNKSKGFGRAEHGILRIDLFHHYRTMLKKLNNSES